MLGGDTQQARHVPGCWASCPQPCITLLQAHGVALGLGGTIVVAVTATLAAIGAAAIPSAGLVTMLMVLQVSFRLSDIMQSSF